MATSTAATARNLAPEDNRPEELPERYPSAEVRMLKEAEPQVAAPDASAEASEKQEKKRGPGLRRLLLPILGVALLTGGGYYGYDWYTTGRFMVSTDDAYVQADIATLSTKVSGYVDTVNVAANQHVHKGDVLVTLDDGDYKIALDQAEAQISNQKLSLKRIEAQIAGAKAALAQARAQKQSAEAVQQNAAAAQDRAQQLNTKDFASTADLDKAQAALRQADAGIAAADAQIAQAEANVETLQAQYDEAQGAMRSLELARAKAQRDFDFTKLRAPFDGVVGNLAVQDGELVAAGTRLLALVPADALYVEANFKETQLAELAPGEQVQIEVDALGGTELTGTVQSLSPASGSSFSLLPAENATGNFTKIVQRVPVRISLPADALEGGKLRAGLSVVVHADSRTLPAGV